MSRLLLLLLPLAATAAPQGSIPITQGGLIGARVSISWTTGHVMGPLRTSAEPNFFSIQGPRPGDALDISCINGHSLEPLSGHSTLHAYEGHSSLSIDCFWNKAPWVFSDYLSSGQQQQQGSTAAVPSPPPASIDPPGSNMFMKITCGNSFHTLRMKFVSKNRGPLRNSYTLDAIQNDFDMRSVGEHRTPSFVGQTLTFQDSHPWEKTTSERQLHLSVQKFANGPFTPVVTLPFPTQGTGRELVLLLNAPAYAGSNVISQPALSRRDTLVQAHARSVFPPAPTSSFELIEQQQEQQLTLVPSAGSSGTVTFYSGVGVWKKQIVKFDGFVGRIQASLHASTGLGPFDYARVRCNSDDSLLSVPVESRDNRISMSISCPESSDFLPVVGVSPGAQHKRVHCIGGDDCDLPLRVELPAGMAGWSFLLANVSSPGADVVFPKHATVGPFSQLEQNLTFYAPLVRLTGANVAGASPIRACLAPGNVSAHGENVVGSTLCTCVELDPASDVLRISSFDHELQRFEVDVAVEGEAVQETQETPPPPRSVPVWFSAPQGTTLVLKSLDGDLHQQLQAVSGPPPSRQDYEQVLSVPVGLLQASRAGWSVHCESGSVVVTPEYSIFSVLPGYPLTGLYVRCSGELPHAAVALTAETLTQPSPRELYGLTWNPGAERARIMLTGITGNETLRVAAFDGSGQLLDSCSTGLPVPNSEFFRAWCRFGLTGWELVRRAARVCVTGWARGGSEQVSAAQCVEMQDFITYAHVLTKEVGSHWHWTSNEQKTQWAGTETAPLTRETAVAMRYEGKAFTALSLRCEDGRDFRGTFRTATSHGEHWSSIVPFGSEPGLCNLTCVDLVTGEAVARVPNVCVRAPLRLDASCSDAGMTLSAQMDPECSGAQRARQSAQQSAQQSTQQSAQQSAQQVVFGGFGGLGGVGGVGVPPPSYYTCSLAIDFRGVFRAYKIEAGFRAWVQSIRVDPPSGIPLATTQKIKVRQTLSAEAGRNTALFEWSSDFLSETQLTQINSLEVFFGVKPVPANGLASHRGYTERVSLALRHRSRHVGISVGRDANGKLVVGLTGQSEYPFPPPPYHG